MGSEGFSRFPSPHCGPSCGLGRICTYVDGPHCKTRSKRGDCKKIDLVIIDPEIFRMLLKKINEGIPGSDLKKKIFFQEVQAY